jgi:hypothetical protein
MRSVINQGYGAARIVPHKATREDGDGIKKIKNNNLQQIIQYFNRNTRRSTHLQGRFCCYRSKSKQNTKKQTFTQLEENTYCRCVLFKQRR